MTRKIHEPWAANVVGRMYRCGITASELADRCGYTPPYISMVLNGSKRFKTEDSKEATINKIYDALEQIEKEVLR